MSLDAICQVGGGACRDTTARPHTNEVVTEPYTAHLPLWLTGHRPSLTKAFRAYDPLGLSIGTTVNLVAAGNGGPPVTVAVLTLYLHCAPKIMQPSQNPNLIEPGALMSLLC